MGKGKNLSLISGAALAVFAAGPSHAESLVKIQELKGTVVLADGSAPDPQSDQNSKKSSAPKKGTKEKENGCGGDGGCSGGASGQKDKESEKDGAAK